MRLQGIPKAKVVEELGIQDISRLKVWIRKYRKEGFAGISGSEGEEERVQRSGETLEVVGDGE